MISSTVHKPYAFISEFVDCFYLNRGDNIGYRESNAPMLHQELFFNFGDRFELESRHYSYSSGSLRSWVSGIQTKPTTVNTGGKHLTIGVLFKPWGLYQGFGISGKVTSNKIIEPKLILGDAIGQHLLSHINTLSEHELLASLEDCLIAQLRPRQLNNAVIDLLAEIAETGFGKGTIEAFARKANTSSKSVIESFNNAIGISPVKYIHLERVNTAIELAKSCSGKTLTEIGLELGFFDQPHFIRTFKSYCGASPGQYRSTQLNYQL